MGFREKIEEQALKLADVYKTVMYLRIITNINALFLGIILFYLVLISARLEVIYATAGVFVINAVFFFSDYATKHEVFKKKNDDVKQ